LTSLCISKLDFSTAILEETRYESAEEYIVGGTNVSREDYPFMASLRTLGKIRRLKIFNSTDSLNSR
jgi:hypothetical protein